jgi:PHD/YefM family antitoxin component YafN of YafNO toxin-antitoxin module
MKTISIKNDSVPIAKFKTGLSKWIKGLRDSGLPVSITQNGRPAGMLFSPDDYGVLV